MLAVVELQEQENIRATRWTCSASHLHAVRCTNDEGPSSLFRAIPTQTSARRPSRRRQLAVGRARTIAAVRISTVLRGGGRSNSATA